MLGDFKTSGPHPVLDVAGGNTSHSVTILDRLVNHVAAAFEQLVGHFLVFPGNRDPPPLSVQALLDHRERFALEHAGMIKVDRVGFLVMGQPDSGYVPVRLAMNSGNPEPFRLYGHS